MTKSDAEIERLVEDWLEAEARPMPHHVLESSLEAVSRTTQARQRPPFSMRWLNQRALTTVMVAVVIIVALIAGPTILDNLGSAFGPQPGVGPHASLGETLQWDAVDDFLRSPAEMNPSPDRYGNRGVWSYRWSERPSHDPTGYRVMPAFRVREPGVELWYVPGLGNLQVIHAAGQLHLHPWGDSSGTDAHFAVLAWRSPVTGLATISGDVDVDATCGDGTVLTVDHGLATLQTIRLIGRAETFALMTEVTSGDALYFVVDPNEGSTCDTTFLEVTISVVVPADELP